MMMRLELGVFPIKIIKIYQSDGTSHFIPFQIIGFNIRLSKSSHLIARTLKEYYKDDEE